MSGSLVLQIIQWTEFEIKNAVCSRWNSMTTAVGTANSHSYSVMQNYYIVIFNF